MLFQSLLFSDLLLRLPPLTLLPNLKEGKLIPQRPNAVISLPSLSSGIFDTKIISEIKFLDALASLKTMFKIQSFMFSNFKITEYYRVLQSVTECYRVLQSVTECNRVL